MKPILLKMAGIHSYREMQVIDFAALCEAGLFGIFGPTGSGKSTILDAITLALYGQVVRQGGKSHPQEVLNQLEKRAFVSFTFEVGQRELRRRYTIEREFGVDGKGNKRPPDVRLIECAAFPGEEDRVIESKATAATEAVESLIGLTVHDFTRAVVLPQGQFARFLQLKSSERNDMLQRLFHLHAYGEKLNERIRTLYEADKAKVHHLQLELAGLGEAGPEALQAAEAELAAASERETLFRQEQELWAVKMREMEQVYQWQKERADVLAKLSALEQEEPRMKELTVLANRIEASLQVWPQLKKVRELIDQQQKAEELAARMRQEAEQAAAEMAAAEHTYSLMQERVRTEEPQLIEQRSKLAQALEVEQELRVLREALTREEAALQTLLAEMAELTAQLGQDAAELAAQQTELRQIDDQLQAIAVSPERRQHLQQLRELRRQWEQEAKKLQELEAEQEAARNALAGMEADRERLMAAWQNAVAAREQMQLELQASEANPPVTDKELEYRRERLLHVKQLGKEWRELEQQQAEWQRKWAEAEPQWLQAQKQTESAEAAWKQLEQQQEAAQQQREWLLKQRQEWEIARTVHALREALREGETCPVCGSTHHPGVNAVHAARGEEAPQLQELDGQLQQVDLRLKELDVMIRTAMERAQTARVEQAAMEQRRMTLAEEQKALIARREAVREACRELGPDWMVATIDELLQCYRVADQELQQKMERRERHALLLDEQRQRLQQLREQELEQMARADKSNALMAQWQEKLVQLDGRIRETADLAGQLHATLVSRLDGLTLDTVDTEYAKLQEWDQQADVLRKRRHEQEERRTLLQSRWEAQQRRQTGLAIQEAGMKQRLQERKTIWAEKERFWRERTQGQQAAVLLEETEGKLQALRSAASDAEARRTAAFARRQQTLEGRMKAEESHHQLTIQAAEAETALHSAMRQHGFSSPDEVEQAWSRQEHLASYQEQINQYQNQRLQLRFEAERLAEKLAGRKVEPEEWEQAQAHGQAVNQQLQAAKDEMAVARQTLSVIQTNHQKWQELQQQLREVEDELSRLEELRKLFEGKAFVQYIAEEKLASVARDASYHLRRMTKNRYALELGDEGEFVLRDEGMGGIRRPVSTLSGGETFLTSLALALALSVEIQMRGGRLEFFFLDEGFGTLDPELLEVVLDALERLRMSHFTVGLISHVPELRVRVPRRLIVTPAEALGAGSRIHLESD